MENVSVEPVLTENVIDLVKNGKNSVLRLYFELFLTKLNEDMHTDEIQKEKKTLDQLQTGWVVLAESSAWPNCKDTFEVPSQEQSSRQTTNE